ncbi:MAG: APC family permease, partial [Deltaproteobacteria bacterium]|nr:APC family permease [Deltaproteobacteria bacterium]
WGFQAGWWRTISVYIDNTIYVVLAGSYLASVAELSPLAEYAFKATVIIVFTYINIRGIRDVGFVSTAISILVMAAFGMVAVVGFANWQMNPFDPFTPPDQTLLQSIGGAIAIGMWMYAGYESMSTVAGELKDPQVIPRATLITVPLIMAVYILPTMGGLASLGEWTQWASDGGYSYGDVVTQVAPAFGLFFVFVAIMAQFSIFNTYIASGSRGFFALADDNLAPRILVKCSKDRGVPYVAVLSLGIFSLIICMFPFTVIVVFDVMLFMSAYVLIFVSACILRFKEGGLHRPFRIPLGNLGFLLMCVPPVAIATLALFINGTDYFVGGIFALMSGPLVYVLFKRRYGGLTVNDAEKHPSNPETGLAIGDLKRIASFFAGVALIGLIANFFLPWYDDPPSYDTTYGVVGLFDILMACVRWITLGSGALAAILWIASRRIEPKSPTELAMPVRPID